MVFIRINNYLYFFLAWLQLLFLLFHFLIIITFRYYHLIFCFVFSPSVSSVCQMTKSLSFSLLNCLFNQKTKRTHFPFLLLVSFASFVKRRYLVFYSSFVCNLKPNLRKKQNKIAFSFSFVVVCCFVFYLFAVRFPLAIDR